MDQQTANQRLHVDYPWVLFSKGNLEEMEWLFIIFCHFYIIFAMHIVQ